MLPNNHRRFEKLGRQEVDQRLSSVLEALKTCCTVNKQ